MSEATVSPHVTVDTLVSAWNSHDPQRLAACYTPDAVYEDIPLQNPMRGQAALATMFRAIFTAFPDLVVTAGKQAEQGDCLAWEWIRTGTHLADFHGLPATGTAVTLRGVSLCLIHKGKVAEDREYWDLATLRRQFGQL